MSLLFLFLPGLLLLIADPITNSLIVLLTHVFISSLFYYMFASIVTFVIPFPLQLLIFFSYLGILIVIFLKRDLINLSVFTLNKKPIIFLLVLVSIFILRLTPMLFQETPSDIRMGGYANSARQIYESDRFVYDQKMEAPGFPSLNAVLSIVNGRPIYRNNLMLSCFAFGLLPFVLFLLLKKYFDEKTSFLSSVFSSLIAWGNPVNIMALVFLVYSISIYADTKNNNKLLLFLAISGLIAATITSPFLIIRSEILLIPTALCIAWTIKVFKDRIKYIDLSLLIISLFIFSVQLCISKNIAVVSESDINAFQWIDNTVSHKALFIVNGADAGAWIPAIIDRAAISLNDNRTKKAGYIYIGSKSNGKVEIVKDEIEKSPRYRRVYSNAGGAQVWKIL